MVMETGSRATVTFAAGVEVPFPLFLSTTRSDALQLPALRYLWVAVMTPAPWVALVPLVSVPSPQVMVYFHGPSAAPASEKPPVKETLWPELIAVAVVAVKVGFGSA